MAEFLAVQVRLGKTTVEQIAMVKGQTVAEAVERILGGGQNEHN